MPTFYAWKTSLNNHPPPPCLFAAMRCLYITAKHAQRTLFQKPCGLFRWNLSSLSHAVGLFNLHWMLQPCKLMIRQWIWLATSSYCLAFIFLWNQYFKKERVFTGLWTHRTFKHWKQQIFGIFILFSRVLLCLICATINSLHSLLRCPLKQ